MDFRSTKRPKNEGRSNSVKALLPKFQQGDEPLTLSALLRGDHNFSQSVSRMHHPIFLLEYFDSKAEGDGELKEDDVSSLSPP